MPSRLHLRDRLRRALHLERQQRHSDSSQGGFSPVLDNTTALPPPTIAPGPVRSTASEPTSVHPVLPTPKATPPTIPQAVTTTTHPLHTVRSRSSTTTGLPLGEGLPGALYDEPDAERTGEATHSSADLLGGEASRSTEQSTPSLDPVVTPLLAPPGHSVLPSEHYATNASDPRTYGDLGDLPQDEGTLTPVIPVTTTLRSKGDVLTVKDSAVDPTAGQDVAGLAHPGDWEVPVRMDGSKPADSAVAIVGVEKESEERRREREDEEVREEERRRSSLLHREEKEEREMLMQPAQAVEVAPMGVPSPLIGRAAVDRRVSAAGSSVYDDEARQETPFEEKKEKDAVNSYRAHRASSYAAAAGIKTDDCPPPPVPPIESHFFATHSVESTQGPLTHPPTPPHGSSQYEDLTKCTSISTATSPNAPPSPVNSSSTGSSTISSISHTTHHTMRTAAPVTIERIVPIHKEIINKEITREIHTSEIRPIIQPVLKTEYLPAQHIVVMPDGSRVEITEDEAKRQGWDEIARENVVVGRTGGLREMGVELGASQTPLEAERRLGAVGGEGQQDERLDRAFDDKIDRAFQSFAMKGKMMPGKEDEGYAGVDTGRREEYTGVETGVIEGLGTADERIVVTSGPHAGEGIVGGMDRMNLKEQARRDPKGMDEANKRSTGVAV